MGSCLASFIILLLFATPSMAAVKSVTYYLDGAKVETVNYSKNGYLEVILPNGVIADSIRIRPAGNAVIDRVDIHRSKRESKTAREIITLEERKNLLKDRLKALETREEIFLSAAKSQSARAPRKTKNNPEPMANIRKGTDYAIGQLESVYTLRRKTEKELASLEAKLSSLRTTGGGGSVCRVWLIGKNGIVHISYFTPEWHWKPFYDFRLQGDGRVRMTLRAVLSPHGKSSSIFVVPTKFSIASDTRVIPVTGSKQFEKIADYIFIAETESFSHGPTASLAFTFNNMTDQRFPSGDAACYWRGEYLGVTPFKGIETKGLSTLSFGTGAAVDPVAERSKTDSET